MCGLARIIYGAYTVSQNHIRGIHGWPEPYTVHTRLARTIYGAYTVGQNYICCIHGWAEPYTVHTRLARTILARTIYGAYTVGQNNIRCIHGWPDQYTVHTRYFGGNIPKYIITYGNYIRLCLTLFMSWNAHFEC